MSELPATFTSLLTDFAQANGLDANALLLSQQVLVDDRLISLAFEGINGFGDAILYAPLGKVPAERAAQAHRIMLEGNHLWAATGGATLGIMEDGTATMCYRTPLSLMQAEGFAETLTLFAGQAQNWALILGTPGTIYEMAVAA